MTTSTRALLLFAAIAALAAAGCVACGGCPRHLEPARVHWHDAPAPAGDSGGTVVE